jgi:hypothetical protein
MLKFFDGDTDKRDAAMLQHGQYKRKSGPFSTHDDKGIARVMWSEKYAKEVSVAEWWEDQAQGAAELRAFSSQVSQYRVNASGVERVNSAYQNVVGNKRGAMGCRRATMATQIFFNMRAQDKVKRQKTSNEAHAEWSSSDESE